MPTRVIVFPFDLFGSGGSGAGAQLLADELREMLADNRRETVVTRARAYTEHVRIREVTLDTVAKVRSWRRRGEKLATQVFGSGEFLLWLGGNHLGCLPVYDHVASLKEPPLVVQLDAHLDIHHFGDCTKEPSHGNFLRHARGPLPPIVNVGHRELLLTPEEVAKFYRQTFSAVELMVDSQKVLKAVRAACASASAVLIDLDCDVLDSAFFPAVSRPVPFGLTPQQLLAVIEAAWSPKVCGLMLSEFDPGRDRDDRSLALLVWLVEHLLLKRYERAG